jgi:hypothetical protein
MTDGAKSAELSTLGDFSIQDITCRSKTRLRRTQGFKQIDLLFFGPAGKLPAQVCSEKNNSIVSEECGLFPTQSIVTTILGRMAGCLMNWKWLWLNRDIIPAFA